MATAAVLAGHWVLSFIGVVLIGLSPGRSGVGLVRSLLVLVLLEAPLILCWCIVWFRSIGGRSSVIAGSLLLFPVIALLALKFFFDTFGPRPPWYVVEEYVQSVRAENDLVKIDACAWLYKNANGRFPVQLSEIRHWDSYCLDDFAFGSHWRYRYHYVGAKEHFQVRAEIAKSFWVAERPWTGNQSDESGLVWLLGEPQTLVPLSNGPHHYRKYLECLRNAGATTRDTLRAVVTERKCLQMGDQFVSDNEIKTDKAHIVFTPATDKGSFTLESRPLLYGDVTIRSYIADQSGKIHATAANRSATMSDPLADDREFWSAVQEPPTQGGRMR